MIKIREIINYNDIMIWEIIMRSNDMKNKKKKQWHDKKEIILTEQEKFDSLVLKIILCNLGGPCDAILLECVVGGTNS